MKKIKDFKALLCNEDFWVSILFFFIIAAISIGAQSLLVWLGNLFPLIGNGVALDALFGFVLIYLILVPSTASTEYKIIGNLVVGLLAIVGIYVSIVLYFHAGLLFGCIVLLGSALWRLHKIDADPSWLYAGACYYLLYCIGAYFALIFNGFKPAINIYGLAVISVMALCIWLVPLFSYKGAIDADA